MKDSLHESGGQKHTPPPASHTRRAMAGLLGASVLAACATSAKPDETARPCQLADATYGTLTIGSYTAPALPSEAITSPAAPPPEPANVRVDISVDHFGVDL